MKRVVLCFSSAPLFSNNMGCNALTYGSIAVLSDVARQLEVEFQYVLVGNPSQGHTPPELSSHKIALVEQLPVLTPRNVFIQIAKKQYSQFVRARKLLRHVNVVVTNAWGDSFSDIYGVRRFNSVMTQFDYAFKRHIPLILLPQTIGPFVSNYAQKKAANVLRKANLVCARDPLSMQCAETLNPEIDVENSVDMAMFMPYKPFRKESKKNVTIVGVNPSGLLWRGGYSENNQFGLKENYPTLIRKLISTLLTTPGIEVVLIGHDIRGPSAGDGTDDFYVCKQLQREFPQCRIGPFFYSPTEAKSYISGLDILIGARMHCCIAAYSAGIPVFPMAYSRKFEGLFREGLNYKHGTNLITDNCLDTLARLKMLLREKDETKQLLLKKTAEISGFKEEIVGVLVAKMKPWIWSMPENL